MASTRRRPSGRQWGSIEQLPSGALRVAVYAGIGPVCGRRHYLGEVIPAGPTADAEASRAVERLAGQVDERRNPGSSASVDQLQDRYLARPGAGAAVR